MRVRLGRTTIKIKNTAVTLEGPLSTKELRQVDAYWRASNYLSVGHIYLLDSPPLKSALTREHIKPRCSIYCQDERSVIRVTQHGSGGCVIPRRVRQVTTLGLSHRHCRSAASDR